MSLPNIYPTFQYWAEQTVWIYSDPHFGNKNLKQIFKNRPSDEEHIKIINSYVGRKDTLILLGDIGNIECVRKLHGYKVLITGNHDIGRTKYKRYTQRHVFNANEYTKAEVIKQISKEYPNWDIRLSTDIFSKYWCVTVNNKLFDEVYDGALIIGEKLILSHEPVNIPWLFNIHGHVHDETIKNDAYHLNVCSDAIGYKPINLNTFLKSSGALSNIQSIHRLTINEAINRKNNKEKEEYKDDR